MQAQQHLGLKGKNESTPPYPCAQKPWSPSPSAPGEPRGTPQVWNCGAQTSGQDELWRSSFLLTWELTLNNLGKLKGGIIAFPGLVSTAGKQGAGGLHARNKTWWDILSGFHFCDSCWSSNRVSTQTGHYWHCTPHTPGSVLKCHTSLPTKHAKVLWINASLWCGFQVTEDFTCQVTNPVL